MYSERMSKKFILKYALIFLIFAVSAFHLIFILSSCEAFAQVTYDAGEAGVFKKAPNDLLLDGYSFGGWFYDTEYRSPYSEADRTNGNITVYAKWIPNSYSVVFKIDRTVNCDDESLVSQTVYHGEKADVPYLSKENSDLSVVGWYLDEELTEEWISSSPITEDTVIYPKWGGYYDSIYFNAPKIYIQTENSQKIVSKEEYINCSVSITNSDETSLKNAEARIRGRGNTTWSVISDKKPYRLKFNKKTDLFGMGKEKDYLLIANYIDMTLMRNDLVYDTATKLGLDYTTETEWVHLFLNGSYEGLYLLCEQTETGKHRVNIGKDDEEGHENKSGDEIGFLIEFDGAGDYGDDRFFKLPAVRTALGVRQWRSNYTINIKSPDGEHITDAQYEYIKDYVTKVNHAIAIRDYSTLCELVDIDSLINYFIVTEISYAVDMGWAFYLYKPAGEKLYFGPVWDYDQAFGSSNYGGETYESWYSGEENLWFTWLLESKLFRNDVKKRWEEVYEDTVLKMNDRISYLYTMYKYDAKANFIRWDKAIGYPYWRSPEKIVALKTYDANVLYLRKWLKNRIEWMNETIEAW